MQAALLSLAAVAFVSVAGQAAAQVLTRLRYRSASLLVVLSALAAGAMAGEALLHALPEAAEAWQGHDVRGLGLLVTGGFGIAMVASSVLRHRACCRPTKEGAAAPYTWSTLMGDSLCNFADGVAITASFLVSVPLGIAATVAILVHELPQEIGQCAVLLRGGMAPRKALAWNAVSAIPAFLGVLLVLALPFSGTAMDRLVLPAVAGAFLHIAVADLLPELRRAAAGVSATRVSAGFAAGIALMALLLLGEG